jgi:hypothetical protein
LNTLATSATAAYLSLTPAAPRPDALAHGYTTAAACGALILLASAVIAATMITASRPLRPSPQR